MVLDTTRRPARISAAHHVTFEGHTPSGDTAASEAVAFMPVRALAELIKTRVVTSTELTKMYLARLKRLDSTLHCVVTVTEDRALKQAAAADADIAGGKYRGPLQAAWSSSGSTKTLRWSSDWMRPARC
jgi:hypothetical protein